MNYIELGKKEHPLIVMLPGSFSPANSMEHIYTRLQDSYHILAITYNGLEKGSKDFTSRQQEAKEIIELLQRLEISSIHLLYGQSMGAEIGIELLSQLQHTIIHVDASFFDGAPCIHLSRVYKAFMHKKFKMVIKMLQNRSIDEILEMKVIQKLSNGDVDSYRALLEPMVEVASLISDQSVQNQNECCYGFDFPQLEESIQEKMVFFYSQEEKAYRSCFEYVKKAYPKAQYKIVSGYGHLSYALKCTDDYIQMLETL